MAESCSTTTRGDRPPGSLRSPTSCEPPGTLSTPRTCTRGEGDEWALEDLPAARELVETTDGAELFLYPGDSHVFADKGLSDYDGAAAKLLEQRVLAFLAELE
jgi:dienelactone hydrolase